MATGVTGADPRGSAFNTPPVGLTGGGYVRVRQRQPDGSWKIVRVHESKLTPGQLAAARRNGLNTMPAQPTPNAGGGGGGTGVAGATQEPAPPQVIDPRDGTYQNDLARYAYDRDTGIAALNAESSTLASNYNRGAADIGIGYDRDRFDSNANLASRGIVRSGEYQRRGADRLMQRARQTADLERQYGTGAQADIARRLADINAQYGLNSSAALQGARDRYATTNPASTYVWSALG